MSCEHLDFEANVEVSRITDGEDGELTNIYADVRVWCKECGEALCFIGVPPGLSPRQPRVEIGAKELRCPMRPESSPPEWGSGGPGFDVERGGARSN